MKLLLIFFLIGFVSCEGDVHRYGYYTDADGAKRGIEKPECFFEELTGACCVRAAFGGTSYRTCIELALQLNEMRALTVVHVNDKEVLSKDVSAGSTCTTLPHPYPPTKICLNIYYGGASWSQKTIETCGALEFGSLVHIRFDCIKFEEGKFRHHSDIQPEKYGLVNVYWQNGKPRFNIVSQPIPQNVINWIKEQWTKIKNIFRQKSKKFVNWLAGRK